jgi:hypothetical protein
LRGIKPKPIAESTNSGITPTYVWTGNAVGGAGAGAVIIGGMTFDYLGDSAIDCGTILTVNVGGGSDADVANNNRVWRTVMWSYDTQQWEAGPWHDYNNADQTNGTDFVTDGSGPPHFYYPEIEFGVWNTSGTVFYYGDERVPFFVQHDDSTPYGRHSPTCELGV